MIAGYTQKVKEYLVFFCQRRHTMIIFHVDVDYEVIKQRRDELIEEARLLSIQQAAKPYRPPFREQMVSAFCAGLLQAGRQLTAWGDRLQTHYSPEKRLPAAK
jgi:hypothetical protein